MMLLLLPEMYTQKQIQCNKSTSTPGCKSVVSAFLSFCKRSRFVSKFLMYIIVFLRLNYCIKIELAGLEISIIA